MERIANSVHLLQPLLSSLSPSSAESSSTSHRSPPFTHSSPPPPDSSPSWPRSLTSHLLPTPLSRAFLRPCSTPATIIANTAVLQSTKAVSEAVKALGANGVQHILPVGPLPPFERPETVIYNHLPWLDEQEAESVVYISFGSRTAALETSGCKFLWVVKGSKVDKEDEEEVEAMVGEAFLEKTEGQGQGKVVKGWVEKELILAHPAIGGFVSHCGWNSVMEAAALGVPVLECGRESGDGKQEGGG